MVVYKCDRCGREVFVWLEVSSAVVNADHDYQNVRDVLKYNGRKKMLCKPCFAKLIELMEKIDG